MIVALTFIALVTSDSVGSLLIWASLIAVVLLLVLTLNMRPPGPPGAPVGKG